MHTVTDTIEPAIPTRASLAIDAQQQPDAYVVRLHGELASSECGRLEDAIETAEQSRASRIVLDLEELTYIDSSGLATLLNLARRSVRRCNRLQLTRGRGFAAEMLRLTGLDQTLPLVDPALCPEIRRAGAVLTPLSRG